MHARTCTSRPRPIKTFPTVPEVVCFIESDWATKANSWLSEGRRRRQRCGREFQANEKLACRQWNVPLTPFPLWRSPFLATADFAIFTTLWTGMWLRGCSGEVDCFHGSLLVLVQASEWPKHRWLVQNSTLSRDILGKIEAWGRHFFQKVEGEGGILTLLTDNPYSPIFCRRLRGDFRALICIRHTFGTSNLGHFCIRHPLFLRRHPLFLWRHFGPPSKYWPGSTLLNFTQQNKWHTMSGKS